MRIFRTLIKIILPLIILAAAFLFTRQLIAKRQAPARQVRQNLGALVELVVARPESREIVVTANGTVEASRETAIVTQVNGLVATLSGNLKAGGFLRQDEVLFTLEKVDYELAVEQARAGVARAESTLALAESKARVAQAEWNRLHPDGEAPSPLALQLPQLAEARAGLASAKASLTRAETDLGRTEIKAPFNCRVKSESLEIGQFVRSGNTVAVLSGTDAAEVLTPTPLADLGLIATPTAAAPQKGARAAIRIADATASHVWPGRVVRSLGEVDPKSRMVRLVIEAPDPYGLASGQPGAYPLMPGMFVTVELKGERLDNIFVLPRRALRENSMVWLADSDDRLRLRPVTVVREERDEIWINKGLLAGDRIITTALAGAADGLAVRPTATGGQP